MLVRDDDGKLRWVNRYAEARQFAHDVPIKEYCRRRRHESETVMRELREFGVCGIPETRVIVVGEAPNRAMAEAGAENDDARVCVIPRIVESTYEGCARWYRQTFVRVNLLTKWPGRDPNSEKGDNYDYEAAKVRASRLLGCFADLVDPYYMILLGRRVQRSIFSSPWDLPEKMLDDPPLFFEEDEFQPNLYVVTVPHPSGASDWWNSSENAAKAQSFWYDASKLAEANYWCDC